MTSTDNLKLQSVIKFCLELNKSLTETLRIIKESGAFPSCGKMFVFIWHERFCSGILSTEGEWTGQHQLWGLSERLTVHCIFNKVGISKTIIYKIPVEDINMSKV